MKVSIITSCYNRRSTIGQTIESVLAQDYPDIEHIIIDGASTDGSVDVIDRYRDRKMVDKVVSEPDSGMYEAINKGIRLATGDVVGLLHSDDFFFDSHVVADIAALFRATGADVVYGNGLYVDASDTSRVVRNWVSGRYHRWKVRLGWLPLHPTVYIRRDVLMRLGLYDESYRVASDSDFLVRCLYENRLHVEYLNRYFVKMRMGGLSTGGASRSSVWREDVRMYRSHGFWGVPEKLLKMGWKVPQYIDAKLRAKKIKTDSKFHND